MPSAGAAARARLEARIRHLLEAGDARQAATVAIQGFGPELLRYLRALLGEEVDAKDAFSTSCERLWRGLPGFRGDSSFRTWAFQLAWSAAADLRKDRWRMRRRRLETQEEAELPSPSGTRSYLRVERMRITFEVLREALTLEERALLQLRLDQRLSWAECAEVLAARDEAATPDALMKRYERIKAKLARLAAREKR